MSGTFVQLVLRPGTVLAVFSLAACAVCGGDVHAQPPAPNQPAAELAEQSLLPATDLSLSLLSFAVGVAACLLVVRAMLPTLVRAHCAEIVRDYIDRNSRDSGVKVVVIDRDSQVRGPETQPVMREAAPPQQVRVDGASTLRPPNRGTAPPTTDAKSILGRVYEQNVQLRDQLRQQAERNHP